MINFAKTKKYKNGFKRGEHETKPCYTLIPHKPLERLALHYTLGAKKYGKNNWKKAKGEDREEFKDSAIRHVLAWAEGKKDENHASAAIWNILNYEYFEMD